MVLQKLIELLAPASCVGCQREGNWLCDSCLASDLIVPLPACYRCERLMTLGRSCDDCLEDAGIQQVTVGATYQGHLKELIRRLKFERSQSAATLCADLILAQLDPSSVVDAITAVPVSPTRFRERGYNQSALIARLVAKRSGVPYVETLRRSSNGHQIGLGRHERLAAIHGAFAPLRRLDGLRVLVIDDVLTTGATLAECASVLSSVGAKSVTAATVARR